MIPNSRILLMCLSVLAPAAGAAPCKVDLKLVNIGNKSEPVYKLGINVGIGGGAPRLYELDTGGPGFWAAYNSKDTGSSQWWGGFERMGQPDDLHIQYTSGNLYTADLVKATLQLYPPAASRPENPVCSTGKETVPLAQIQTFSNSKKPGSVKKWKKALAAGKPPLEQFFYGDFGAALHPHMGTDGLGVFTPLAQFDAKTEHNGFLLHVGPIPEDGRAAPYVQLGLDAAELQSFPYWVSMNLLCKIGDTSSTCPNPATFSNTPVNTFLEQQFSAVLTVTGPTGQSQTLTSMGITMDSGAPHPTLWQFPPEMLESTLIKSPKPVKGQAGLFTGPLPIGTTVALTTPTVNGDPFVAEETVVKKPVPFPINAGFHTKNEPNTGVPYFNTGIGFYSKWDVAFDLTTGKVGFRPVNGKGR